jgi:hypothetical protein
LYPIFFSDLPVDGGGGISAANYLRICLVTSSSRISLGSASIFLPAFTNDLFLSLDFSRELALPEGLPSQLYPILKSPFRKKFIFYYNR